ncbi:MAG: hypothetical protein KY475_00490 [Planctomycetes bacterium]|nr:hypothetical protein [Planctomycetota bacterium]
MWMRLGMLAMLLTPLSAARAEDEPREYSEAPLQFAAPPSVEEPLIPPPPEDSPAPQVQPRQVDLSIRSIRSARTNLTPPPAFDAQGNPLADPEDFSDQLVTAETIFYPSQYGPNWVEHTRFPEAAGYCHRPLYFEELNLERYGNSLGLAQPAVSAAQFYGTVLALPYMATVERPWICYAPEPWYPPPGVAAPWQPPKRYPLRLDSAAVEAATVTGLILALP